jgi:hypothetical protein
MTTELYAPSDYANIWIAGDYAQAVQACREFCMATPCCVTVAPAMYVYTGGAEDGVCVRLIRYPRFPDEDIDGRAEQLAFYLKAALCQDSFTVETKAQNWWHTTRPDTV